MMNTIIVKKNPVSSMRYCMEKLMKWSVYPLNVHMHGFSGGKLELLGLGAPPRILPWKGFFEVGWPAVSQNITCVCLYLLKGWNTFASLTALKVLNYFVITLSPSVHPSVNTWCKPKPFDILFKFFYLHVQSTFIYSFAKNWSFYHLDPSAWKPPPCGGITIDIGIKYPPFHSSTWVPFC